MSYFIYFAGLPLNHQLELMGTQAALPCPAQILRTGGCGKQTGALHVESVLRLKHIDKVKRQHAVPAPQKRSIPLLSAWLFL